MEDDENSVNEQNKEPKKIEVVTGNGDLTISPVSRYIDAEKPRPKENREIVIPEVKDTVSNNKRDSSKDNNSND